MQNREQQRRPRGAPRRRRRSLGKAYAPSESYYIVNVSVTGALLETREELRVGKVLDLMLDLENGKRVSVSGKVVRVQRPDWGVVAGAGVAFTDCPERSRKVIEEYVNADLTAV